MVIMEAEQLQVLAQYRIMVGYLGEKDRFGWWQSAFFTQGSGAFLTPLFPRTQLLARCNGVTQAAALIHDERIGVGNVYHLFRLPEDLEQGIHQALYNEVFAQAVQKLIASKEAALNGLLQGTDKDEPAGIGPIRAGNLAALREVKFWHRIAGIYYWAFKQGQQIFPYFTDVS